MSIPTCNYFVENEMQIELWYVTVSKYDEVVDVRAGPFINEEQAEVEKKLQSEPGGNCYLSISKTKHDVFKSYE
jgi:hypothetical protein